MREGTGRPYASMANTRPTDERPLTRYTPPPPRRSTPAADRPMAMVERERRPGGARLSLRETATGRGRPRVATGRSRAARAGRARAGVEIRSHCDRRAHDSRVAPARTARRGRREDRRRLDQLDAPAARRAAASPLRRVEQRRRGRGRGAGSGHVSARHRTTPPLRRSIERIHTERCFASRQRRRSIGAARCRVSRPRAAHPRPPGRRSEPPAFRHHDRRRGLPRPAGRRLVTAHATADTATARRRRPGRRRGASA